MPNKMIKVILSITLVTLVRLIFSEFFVAKKIDF